MERFRGADQFQRLDDSGRPQPLRRSLFFRLRQQILDAATLFQGRALRQGSMECRFSSQPQTFEFLRRPLANVEVVRVQVGDEPQEGGVGGLTRLTAFAQPRQDLRGVGSQNADGLKRLLGVGVAQVVPDLPQPFR